MDLLMENLFVVVNAVEGVIFLLLAAYYTAKPEKSTFLISNYAYFSPEKKARYDLAGLGKHVSRVFTVIGVICLAGAGAFWGAGSGSSGSGGWALLVLAAARMTSI